MSKITNDGLTRSATGCFIAVPIWQQWASKGVHTVPHTNQPTYLLTYNTYLLGQWRKTHQNNSNRAWTCDSKYLWEIPDHVTSLIVGLGHDVEEKRFDVVVQRLVVEEQLRQQTQVLTVDLQQSRHKRRYSSADPNKPYSNTQTHLWRKRQSLKTPIPVHKQ